MKITLGWARIFPSESLWCPVISLHLTETCQGRRNPFRSVMANRLGTQLFVSRLSFYTTEEGLQRLFSPFGAVKGARIVRDARSGRPKGFGFVSYDSEAEAQKALSGLNGRIIDGRLIFVEFAKNQEGEKQKDRK